MQGEDTLLLNLLEVTREPLLLADAADRVVRCNSAFERLTGHTSAGLSGTPARGLCASGDHAEPLAGIQQGLEETGEWRGELRVRSADGNALRSAAHIRLLRAADGSPNWYVYLFDDAIKTRMLPDGDGLRTQYDPLTELPNRFLLADRLERALIAGRRAKQSVAVLRLGVDRFNRVNDALGHAFGDRLLYAIAQRLKNAVRRSDTIARIEADQFVLVMALRAEDDTVVVAEKLLKSMQQPFHVEGHALSMTASIGITVFPGDSQESDELLKHANSAMHHAKHAGRNAYQFFSHEMNSKAKHRLQLENDLRQALVRDELVLYYQPKVDVESGRIVGAEALVRWRHPEKGLVPPGDFIPVAEESGLILPLGAWVMQAACRESAGWQARGLAPVRVSVNVSAPQFRDPDIVGQVAAVLGESGLDPSLLELEITESMLMGNPQQVAERLQALRDLGVHISIDDFGTGYSSLSYLSNFPITTMKIDRSFVRDLESSRSTAEITRAIIGLSRGLELEIVAEGAETASHVEFLRQHGCTTVQGFVYSKPVPAEEFAAMLKNGRLQTVEQ